MTIYDGAVTGMKDPQCKNCANIDICKFTGMSEDLEKQLSDIADLARTPFTITLECKYRKINTYSNTIRSSETSDSNNRLMGSTGY